MRPQRKHRETEIKNRFEIIIFAFFWRICWMAPNDYSVIFRPRERSITESRIQNTENRKQQKAQVLVLCRLLKFKLQLGFIKILNGGEFRVPAWSWTSRYLPSWQALGGAIILRAKQTSVEITFMKETHVKFSVWPRILQPFYLFCMLN